MSFLINIQIFIDIKNLNLYNKIYKVINIYIYYTSCKIFIDIMKKHH